MISPTVEKWLLESIDFRLAVYFYMYQYPETTTASLAERLGISPVSLSRAIALGKKGVDKELIPGVLELLKELDVPAIQVADFRIMEIIREQERFERNLKTQKIISKHMGDSLKNWKWRKFPGVLDYVVDCGGGAKRYFDEVTSYRDRLWRMLPHQLSGIARMPGSETITFLCYSEDVYEKLISDRALDEIVRSEIVRTKHTVTVMLLDLDKEEVVAESILISPDLAPVSYGIRLMEENHTEDGLI